jgi:thymidine phosphorylase
LARIAGHAGAPKVKSAGVDLCCKLGQTVARGEVLYRVYARYPADLEFARKACQTSSGYAIGAAQDVPQVSVEF